MKTSSFVKHLAATALLAAFGLVTQAGNPSLYDRWIAQFESRQADLITIIYVTAYLAVAGWVIAVTVAWVKSRPGGGETRRAAELAHGPVAATITVCLVVMMTSQQAEGWIIVPPYSVTATTPVAAKTPAVIVEQEFTLPVQQQAEVDAAIVTALEAARKAPGFVITVECAFGIAIAAVIVGSVGYIVVRAIVRRLDQIRNSISNRIHKIEGGTNQAAALLWSGRKVMETVPDMAPGFQLDFVAPSPGEKVETSGSVPTEELVAWPQWLATFGLEDTGKDSLAGAPGVISRDGSDGHQVALSGATNFVKLAFDRAAEIAGAFERKLTLTVPVGARVNFADDTDHPASAFWRVTALAP